MVITLLDGLYPDYIGRRVAFVGTGTGPATYSNNATTGGDIVTLNNPRIYIDLLFGGVFDTTGTIFAIARPLGSGVRQQWKLFYYTAAGAQATGTAVAGLTFQLGGFGGTY